VDQSINAHEQINAAISASATGKPFPPMTIFKTGAMSIPRQPKVMTGKPEITRDILRVRSLEGRAVLLSRAE
jgi:hypothetical protein